MHSDCSRLPPAVLSPEWLAFQDLNNYALTLTRAPLGFKGPLAIRSVLDRMMVFFASVAGRISQLEHMAKTRA